MAIPDDALEILTDDELKAALRRRVELLRQRLADITVDRMVPDFEETPQRKQAVAVLVQAIQAIQGRLDGARGVLRRLDQAPEKVEKEEK